MTIDKNWVKYLEYLSEHSGADTAYLSEEDNSPESYDDVDGEYFGPEYAQSLSLNWNKFFRGDEANSKVLASVRFNYGENGNYSGYTYGCHINIVTPQIKINERIVKSSPEALANEVLKRMEIYTEALNLGLRSGFQPDNSRFRYFCKVLKEYNCELEKADEDIDIER